MCSSHLVSLQSGNSPPDPPRMIVAGHNRYPSLGCRFEKLDPGGHLYGATHLLGGTILARNHGKTVWLEDGSIHAWNWTEQ